MNFDLMQLLTGPANIMNIVGKKTVVQGGNKMLCNSYTISKNCMPQTLPQTFFYYKMETFFV